MDEEALVSDTNLEPTPQPLGIVNMPKQMGFGVGEAEKSLLFGKLPVLSAQADVVARDHLDSKAVGPIFAEGREKELKKANAFAQLLDLRNANAGGIAYENRRRIIVAFSTPSNPFDTGRSEVQGMPICPNTT